MLQISQETLFRIAEHCPEALGAYLFCAQLVDDELTCLIDRSFAETRYISWTLFRNQLKELAREGLLEYHKQDDAISITLAAE